MEEEEAAEEEAAGAALPHAAPRSRRGPCGPCWASPPQGGRAPHAVPRRLGRTRTRAVGIGRSEEEKVKEWEVRRRERSSEGEGRTRNEEENLTCVYILQASYGLRWAIWAQDVPVLSEEDLITCPPRLMY